jgi:valyl-tRNA synthetase
MATNSSRGNPIAASDGPPVQTTNPPPHVSEKLKAEVRQEAETADASGGSAGLHAAGQDAEAASPGAHVETVEEVVDQQGKADESGK